MRERKICPCRRMATPALSLVSVGEMQMQISCHANSADPSTVSAPAPVLPTSSPAHARGQDKRREMGEALERLSQFTLNLSEPIQETLILLAGFCRERAHTPSGGERRLCLPLSDTSHDFFVLQEHSDPGRVNIRSQRFSAMLQSFSPRFLFALNPLLQK